jgi:hypothetical protein
MGGDSIIAPLTFRHLGRNGIVQNRTIDVGIAASALLFTLALFVSAVFGGAAAIAYFWLIIALAGPQYLPLFRRTLHLA